ncbi:hypothetical protein [Paenimyroides ceti]
MINILKKTSFYLMFAALSVSMIISCNNENGDQDQTKRNENLIVRKSAEQFKAYYTSDDDKEAVIGQLVGEFYWYINTDLGFDADNGDEIEFDVADNKKEKSISIMIDNRIINRSLSPDEMMWANAFDNNLDKTNNTILAAGKQKLYLQCSGGKNDSKTLTVDRPYDIETATKSGKEMAPFIDACLKGGGCVLICKSSVKVSKG